MKLLFNVHCSNEFQEGCEYAFLDLTPELAALILRRREALKAVFSTDSSVTSMSFYDDSPVWVSALPNEWEAEPAGLGDGNPFIEVEDIMAVEDFENLTEPTDCEHMVITSDEVYWTCYPKHLDNIVETRPLDYETVAKAVV